MSLPALMLAALSSVVWLHWTSPMESLPGGGCVPSHLPDRMGTAYLYAIDIYGDTYDFGSHPAAPSGAQDSARVVRMSWMRLYFVRVADAAGNVSCPSDTVLLGPDGFAPARVVIFR